jgi:hypothetical protein
MRNTELDVLHERLAKALKWTIEDTYSMSLSALRELIRTNKEDPKLYQDITDLLQTGRHYKQGTN